MGREGRCCKSAPGKKSFATVFVFALVKPELGTSDDELAEAFRLAKILGQNGRWTLKISVEMHDVRGANLKNPLQEKDDVKPRPTSDQDAFQKISDRRSSGFAKANIGKAPSGLNNVSRAKKLESRARKLEKKARKPKTDMMIIKDVKEMGDLMGSADSALAQFETIRGADASNVPERIKVANKLLSASLTTLTKKQTQLLRDVREGLVAGCRLRLNRTTYCFHQSILGGRYPVLISGTGSARDSEHFEG